MALGWLVAAAAAAGFALLLLGRPVGGTRRRSCPSLFHLPGDLMIAGLFPVHRNSPGPDGTPGRQLPYCRGRLDPWGYSQYQAMRLAVEEINNSSHLLPNLTLGYHMWDTCGENLYLEAILLLGPEGRRHSQDDYTSRVIAVVGPDTTEMTYLSSKILTFYRLPQISYNAKGEFFVSRREFPLLLRMVPNENHQILGLVALVKELGWKWVSAVGSGTRSSQTSAQTLISSALAQGICVHYQGLLTVQEGVLASRIHLKKAIENVERAKTNVTLLLMEDSLAQTFFQIVLELKITGQVWLAPETWIMSEGVSSLPGIETVGTVLGLSIKPVALPQFLPFAKKPLGCPSLEGPPASEPQEPAGVGGCHQHCEDCHLLTAEILEAVLNSSVWHWSFYSYATIYALAQALHGLLGCTLEGCPSKEVLKPWQLHEMLLKVDFALHNHTIRFNEAGDLFLGYKVVTWHWKEGTVSYWTIGMYTSDSLTMDHSRIQWPMTDGQVPTSVCITACQVGQIRSSHALDECTCRCIDCAEGTFQSQTNLDLCLPCPAGTWSPARSSTCFPPVITFLDGSNPTIVALGIVALVDFCLLSGCLLVFVLHRETPVVRAAGGKHSLVMLAALLSGCVATVLFVGRPTPTTCLARQPVLALSFTLCVSCLLVRAFQVLFVFQVALRHPGALRLWLKWCGPYVALGLSTALQGVICGLWLCLSPPSLQAEALSPQETFLCCSEGHFLGLGSAVGYITLLGAACLALAFRGRNLPTNYSEARLLTLSMLVFIMGWGCFMLIYGTTAHGQGRQLSTLQMFTAQASIYAILCTFFLPKCYIILFKPQHNTVAHFQTCIQAYTANTTHP